MYKELDDGYIRCLPLPGSSKHFSFNINSVAVNTHFLRYRVILGIRGYPRASDVPGRWIVYTRRNRLYTDGCCSPGVLGYFFSRVLFGTTAFDMDQRKIPPSRRESITHASTRSKAARFTIEVAGLPMQRWLTMLKGPSRRRLLTHLAPCLLKNETQYMKTSFPCFWRRYWISTQDISIR